MRMPVIAGNWKMHKTSGGSPLLWPAPSRTGLRHAAHCQVVLAPPFTALAAVAEEIKGTSADPGRSKCALGAEGRIYRRDQHSHAAKISGCGMVIVGHSERRQYFGETDATVNRRVQAVLDSTLQPIVCIGETLAERESGKHHSVVAQQLAGGLDGLTRQNLLRIILAYEPVWAIGTGRTASPEIAQEMHGLIREWLSEKFGKEAQEVRILYGGSVKPDNIDALMRQPDIDGALVGGACLEAESFLRIIHYKS